MTSYGQVIFQKKKNPVKKLSNFFYLFVDFIQRLMASLQISNATIFALMWVQVKRYRTGSFEIEDVSTHAKKSPAHALEKKFSLNSFAGKASFVSCYAKGHGQNIGSVFSSCQHFIGVKQTCIILAINPKIVCTRFVGS